MHLKRNLTGEESTKGNYEQMMVGDWRFTAKSPGTDDSFLHWTMSRVATAQYFRGSPK